MNVVTRFAPSPTGSPHIGGIRTALFCYLWAKHNKGKFLLRIEDTDRERLVEGAVKEIEDSLKWLGLDFDDEIIYQSDRKEIHRKYAEKLISEGKAYKCYCTKERLEKLRTEQEFKKHPTGYDKHCRNLTEEQREELDSKNTSFVIRLAMPERGRAEWQDAVRGEMKIDYALSDDQILMKSDGWPTYFLASVIDDHDAGVTDVIRGEEWLPSTPKNIALYEAFGWPVPRFAHMPVTVGPSGKKLSKRDGDTAVDDYRKKGYLPEAILNFLVLLGWNPKTTDEFFTKEELINMFDISNINKAAALFDVKKLDWINSHYIRELSIRELKCRIEELLPELDLLKSANIERILEIERTRLTKLTDITENTEFYLKDPSLDKGILVFKKSTPEATKIGLEAVLDSLKDIAETKWQDVKIEEFNNILTEVVEKNQLTNGDVFWPVRYALSGLDKSPSPSELLWAINQTNCLYRIKKALTVL